MKSYNNDWKYIDESDLKQSGIAKKVVIPHVTFSEIMSDERCMGTTCEYSSSR